MRKFIFGAILTLLLAPVSYADQDQDIGRVTLTPNQQGRMSQVHSSSVKGVAYFDGDIRAVVSSPLTTSEKTTLLADLSALSNAPLDNEADKLDFATSPFRNVTPDEADTWIQNNVTDLASAKVALRRMARVLIYLLRRSDIK